MALSSDSEDFDEFLDRNECVDEPVNIIQGFNFEPRCQNRSVVQERKENPGIGYPWMVCIAQLLVVLRIISMVE